VPTPRVAQGGVARFCGRRLGKLRDLLHDVIGPGIKDSPWLGEPVLVVGDATVPDFLSGLKVKPGG
jgi:hypothetical protein